MNNRAVPGEGLAIIEEYDARGDVYVLDGEIYSTKVANIRINRKDRSLTSIGLKKPFPKPDDEIVGTIDQVQKPFVYIRINQLDGRNVGVKQTAVLYMKGSVRDAPAGREGDIIRAKVKLIRNAMLFVRIDEPELGVIFTSCSKCGGEVVPTGRSFVKCTRCGHRDYRKLAMDYKSGAR
ncbi:MAG: exosome complex RNA-binding protein Csl4 [Nitrososphaerota archaeon]|nr:exosome complex RNA-binding protein Csl4 [Nitrososphaerota archaeon]